MPFYTPIVSTSFHHLNYITFCVQKSTLPNPARCLRFSDFCFSGALSVRVLSKPPIAQFTQKIPYLLKLRTHLYSVAEQHFVKGQPKIAKQNQLIPVKIANPIFSIKKAGFLHTLRWQEAFITATLQLCFYEANRKSFYHLRIPFIL